MLIDLTSEEEAWFPGMASSETETPEVKIIKVPGGTSLGKAQAYPIKAQVSSKALMKCPELNLALFLR